MGGWSMGGRSTVCLGELWGESSLSACPPASKFHVGTLLQENAFSYFFSFFFY